jgi:hypothetical protein
VFRCFTPGHKWYSDFRWNCLYSTAGCLLHSVHSCESTRYCTWLKHCTTSQKVAGSIHNDDGGFCNWSNPSSSIGIPLASHNTSTAKFSEIKELPAYNADKLHLWDIYLGHVHPKGKRKHLRGMRNILRDM